MQEEEQRVIYAKKIKKNVGIFFLSDPIFLTHFLKNNFLK